MSEKTHELRTSMIEGLIAQNEAVDQMIAGAALVTIGGVDGIQEVAESDPELIITVINLLTELAVNQQKSIADLTEKWLSSMDQTDSFVDIIMKYTPKKD